MRERLIIVSLILFQQEVRHGNVRLSLSRSLCVCVCDSMRDLCGTVSLMIVDPTFESLFGGKRVINLCRG
jgi:hypothetical protein